MPIDVQQEAEELVRYYAELRRRLEAAGVRDVADLVQLFERLQRALGVVSRQELAWTSEQTHRVVDALVRMDATLQTLRRLKAAFEADPAPS